MIFLVTYRSFNRKDVINELKEYGEIVYDSPIMSVVGVKTNKSKRTIERVRGVTNVDVGISGKL